MNDDVVRAHPMTLTREQVAERLHESITEYLIDTVSQMLDEERGAALAECLAIVDEKAHDYEGDWSSPEFNYAMDVGDSISALMPGTPKYAERMRDKS